MNRATPLVLAALLTLASLAVTPAAQAAPAVTSVTPSSGSTNGGTVVNVTGAGFAVGAIVQLVASNGNAVTLTNFQASGNSIRGTTPAHAPGILQVKVTNPDGSSTLSGTAFTYSSAPSPTITDVAPTSGPSTGGTTLVITGTGFSTGIKPLVTVAGIQATVQSASATSIIAITSAATVGAGSTSGSVVVSNPDGPDPTNPNAIGISTAAVSAQPYTYVQAPGPSLDTISPGSGDANGGVDFILTGNNFAPGAIVRFIPNNGGPIALATNVFFKGPTQLQGKTPPQTADALTPENVQVINPDGDPANQQATRTSVFTVTPGPSAAGGSLKVTSVDPPQGPSSGGTPVTVGGIGFVAGPGLKVRFGDGIPVPAQFVNSGQVTAIAPPCASPCTDPNPLPSGTHKHGDIQVINPDGSGSAYLSAATSSLFTYTSQVVITSVSAGHGTAAVPGIPTASVDTTGTQEFTIHGSGFTSGCQVFIGGQAAVSVDHCTDTEVVATPPPGPAATYDVQVVNGGGRTATLQGGLAYTLPAVPTLAKPTSKTTDTSPPGNNEPRVSSNGEPVTIKGTGFIPVQGTGSQSDRFIWPVIKFGGIPGIITVAANQDPVAARSTLVVQAPPIAASSIPTGASSDCVGFDCKSVDIQLTNIDGQVASRGAFDSNGNPLFSYEKSAAPDARQDTDPGAPPSPLDGCSSSGCFGSTTDGGKPGTVFGSGFVQGTVLNGVRVGATQFKVGNNLATFDPTHDPPISDDGTNAFIIIPPATNGGKASLVASNPDGQADAAVSNYVGYSKPGTPTLQQGGNVGNANGGGTNGHTATVFNAAQGTLGAGATIYFDTTPVQLAYPYPCGFGNPAVTENCVGGSTGPGAAGNTIKVRPPGHAAGTVSVKVVNRDGQTYTLANGYTYQFENPPAVTGVTPGIAPGLGGSTVMLVGEGFATGSQDGTQDTGGANTLNLSYLKPTVLITGPDGTVTVPQKDVRVVNPGWNSNPSAVLCPTQGNSNPCIQVTLPDHTPGFVDFTVVNPDGHSASLQHSFRYMGTQTGLQVLVPGQTAGVGTVNGGTFIGLSAKGFDPHSAPLALFGPTPAAALPATGVGVASTSLAVATTPRGPAPGATTVFLVDEQGQTLTVPHGFTYSPAIPPAFASVTPLASSVNGGQAVILKGANFAPGSTVCLATLAAASIPCNPTSPDALSPVKFIDAQTLQFTTPSSPPGPVDIVVTNPAGQGAATGSALAKANSLVIPRQQSLFYYSKQPSPVISSINPTSGDLAGGTVVQLTGANFEDGSSVLFDGVPSTNVTFASANSLVAVAPPHTKGAADVQVVLANGLSYNLPAAFTYTGNATLPTPTSGSDTGTTTTGSGGTTTTGGTGSTTTTGGTGGGGTLTTDQIIAANKQVEVTVTRDGSDNLVSFTLPLNLPATPQGVQVFRSNSPFVLVATLDRTSTDFQSRSYLDSNAPLASKYIVTVFYANGQGKATGTDPNDPATGVPGFSQLGSGVSSKDADNAKLTLIGYILVGVLAVFLVVLLIVLVMRGRRPPANAVAAPPASQAVAPPAEGGDAPPAEAAGERHSVNCPNCGSIFEAVGPKPLRMECPTCGKAGILR